MVSAYVLLRGSPWNVFPPFPWNIPIFLSRPNSNVPPEGQPSLAARPVTEVGGVGERR